MGSRAALTQPLPLSASRDQPRGGGGSGLMTCPGGRAGSCGQSRILASRSRGAGPHAPTALKDLRAQSWTGHVLLVSQHGDWSGALPLWQSSIGAAIALLIPAATGGSTSPNKSNKRMKARRMIINGNSFAGGLSVMARAVKARNCVGCAAARPCPRPPLTLSLSPFALKSATGRGNWFALVVGMCHRRRSVG
jgi:hypothetical protein